MSAPIDGVMGTQGDKPRLSLEQAQEAGCFESDAPARYRLDIDESAIYDGERRVLELDTGDNNGWRAATALGARIVELLNAHGVTVVRHQTFCTKDADGSPLDSESEG